MSRAVAEEARSSGLPTSWGDGEPTTVLWRWDTDGELRTLTVGEVYGIIRTLPEQARQRRGRLVKLSKARQRDAERRRAWAERLEQGG